MKIYKQEYWDFTKRHLGSILFFTMCFVAMFSFDDYGVAWDEPYQRDIAITNVNYIVHGDSTLIDWWNRDYGVAFELPLIAVERIFNITDIRQVYLMRHIVSHLFFLLGALFGFRLIVLLYNSKLLAAIGFLFIVLSPRLYAQSFYNTKDIPFMIMFLVCLYYNAIAFRNKRVLDFILLGACVGILINIRIAGIILPIFVFSFLVLDAIIEKKYIHHLKLILFLGLTSIFVLYLSWPFLWTDPINNFIYAFNNMSKFRWDAAMLFKGEFITGTSIKWNYIPVWFSITTPIFFLLTGLSGIILLIVRFIKAPKIFLLNIKERNNIFFLVCFFVPILVSILLKSVLYDGWRHMYFIYPSFVMLAIYSLHFILQKMKRHLFVIAVTLTFTFLIVFMIKNHPHQLVYFNYFVAPNNPEYIRKNFEMDYWGVSYRESLEYILKSDSSKSINLKFSMYSGHIPILILSDSERKRINLVPFEKADYFITNYRWHPGDYDELKDSEYHSFKVGNNTVNKIFKLR